MFFLAGAMTPVFALMFGRLLNAFFAANLEAEVNKFALIILGVAGAALLSGKCCVTPLHLAPLIPL